MKVILYIICAIIILTSCDSYKKVIVLNDVIELEVLEVIFESMTQDKFGYHLAKFREDNCTQIYPKLKIIELSAYYNIWHHNLIEQRDNSKDNFLFGDLKDPLLSLDTVDLKSKISTEYMFEDMRKIGNQCVKFYKEGSNNDVLYFSPIIKMNKENHYHVSLKIMDDKENPEFLFILKRNKNGTFDMIHYIWNDYWPTLGIGDDVDILKGK